MPSESVLVHSPVPLWKDFYVESVEFALQHLKKNNKVYFTVCFKSLPSCPANSLHDLSVCSQCVKHQEYVVDILCAKYPETFYPIPIVNLDPEPNNPDFHQGLNSLSNVKDISDLQKLTYKNLPIGSLIISQIADIVNDAFFDVFDYLKLISHIYYHSCKFYEQTISLICQYNISSVYVWNGRRPASGTVVHAARMLNIYCLTHIIGSRLGDIYTCHGPYVHCLKSHHENIESIKYLLLIDNSELSNNLIAAKQFFDFQRDPSKKTGFGQWNFSRQFTLPFKPSTDKPILAIFTSTPWEKVGMSDYLPFFYEDEYVGLEKVLNIKYLHDKYYVVVRFHPNSFNVGKNELLRVKNIINKFEGIVDFIEPSSPISSYSLLDASHVVATFGSTMGIEAVYNKKPSILLGPALYQSLGCNIIPISHAQLGHILLDGSFNRSTSHPDSYKALAYGLYESRRTHISFKALVLKNKSFYLDGIPLNPRPTILSRLLKKIVVVFAMMIPCKNRSS